jgi:hypothetical protein
LEEDFAKCYNKSVQLVWDNTYFFRIWF